MCFKVHSLQTLVGTALLFALIQVTLPLSAAPLSDAPDAETRTPNERDYALSRAGDAKRGKIVFMRCKACHNEYASKNTKTGPNLNQFFGRASGQSENYDGYSKALKDAAIIWGEAELDAWLKNPKGFLPGNKMSFSGVRTQKDRNDLIAYLRSVQTPTKP